jgi:hypothetical protein
MYTKWLKTGGLSYETVGRGGIEAGRRMLRLIRQ